MATWFDDPIVSEWDDSSSPLPEMPGSPKKKLNAADELGAAETKEKPKGKQELPPRNPKNRPPLVQAVILHESSDNPNAEAIDPVTRKIIRNKDGTALAAGSMQLTIPTAKRMGLTERDRYDEEKNITAGSKYLDYLTDKYHGDKYKALVAYNWGPGNVDKLGTERAPESTKKYARSTLKMEGLLTKGMPETEAKPWSDDEIINPRIQKAIKGDSVVTPSGSKKPLKEEVADTSHDSSEYAPPKKPDAIKDKIIPAARDVAIRAATGGLTSPTAFTRGVIPLAEAGLQAATGMATTIGGGLAGGVRALGGLASGESVEEATGAGADVVRGAQEFTYRPRTEGGEAVSKATQYPMEKAGEGLGMIGGKIGGVIGPKSEAAGEEIGKATLPVLGALAGGQSMLKTAKAAEGRALTDPIMTPGKDYTPLRNLTPQQMERYVRMKEQGLDPTLASVTRDPAQYTFEEQTAKTKAGADLRTREVENNEAIIKAVKDTDTVRTGKKTTENERETGHSVATALERKAKESLENTDRLYERARSSGETDVLVDTKPLEKWLKQHKAESLSVPEIASVKAKLDQLKAMNKKQGGLTINDYEILYKVAGDLSGEGSSSKFMRQVKKHINDATEGIGGDLYREARAARLKHGFEFEDRAAIARLVEKKTRTDYKTSNEDVFRKTVVGSSLEELKDVTNSLLSVDAKSHPEAIQAVRNLQGQTIDYILDKATSGISLSEKGAPPFSPHAFKRAIREIGRDKLEHLLGPDALTRLDDILKTSREVKTSPGRVSGSDTNVNLRVMAERQARESAAKHLVSRVPIARSVFEYMKSKKEAAATRMSVEEALKPRVAPPEEIAAGAAAAKKRQRQRSMEEAGDIAGGLVPAYPAVVESTERQE